MEQHRVEDVDAVKGLVYRAPPRHLLVGLLEVPAQRERGALLARVHQLAAQRGIGLAGRLLDTRVLLGRLVSVARAQKACTPSALQNVSLTSSYMTRLATGSFWRVRIS